MSYNLLFFCSDYQVGLTTALSEQALELKNLPEIKLSCISSEKEMEPGLHEKLKQEHIDMTIIPELDVHKNLKKLAKVIEEIIIEKKITHINVHNNWQLAIISYIKYKKIIPKKFKIIYTIHGYRHNSPFKSFIAISVIGLALLLFADRVISMSTYVSKRFWFIAYKTDLVFYIMNKPEFNKKTNVINSSPIQMVFPAQFRHGKNQDMLIEAVNLYIKETGDKTIKLYLPGDGTLLDDCKKLAQLKGINNNIIFPGKLPHKKVIELYETTNIAIIASNVETYGRCIAEPFALGRCIITKKTGVALDIIKNGENGFFFSTIKELVKILKQLHNNPTIITKTGNNAFEDKFIFSSKSVMQSYINAIRKA